MPEPFASADPVRFQAALQRFDAANAQDPNFVKVGDELVPRELVYARWLTDWVLEASAKCARGIAAGRSLPTSLPLGAAPGQLSYDPGGLSEVA